MYPAYALLSHDAAHASVIALRRHYPQGETGPLPPKVETLRRHKRQRRNRAKTGNSPGALANRSIRPVADLSLVRAGSASKRSLAEGEGSAGPTVRGRLRDLRYGRERGLRGRAQREGRTPRRAAVAPPEPTVTAIRLANSLGRYNLTLRWLYGERNASAGGGPARVGDGSSVEGFKMRRWRLALAGTALAVMLAGNAEAGQIDYIFIGTGDGSLDGIAFDGAFSVTMVSDTATISSGGGKLRNTGTTTFVAGLLTATFTAPVLIENTAAPGFMGFGQTTPPFPDESLTSSVFETYDLASALGVTSGGLSVAPATFATSGGDLNFDSITALSFQATVPGVPEPSTWAMMLLGFAGLAFAAIAPLGRASRSRRNSSPLQAFAKRRPPWAAFFVS
jgi:hypothetical protein